MSRHIEVDEESRNAEIVELEKLRSAIRKHRDQRGDDRCWMDDEELYKALPEGYVVPERDSTVELKNCERFIQCRHNPGTTYVSPEREIESLRAEMKSLRDEIVRRDGILDPLEQLLVDQVDVRIGHFHDGRLVVRTRDIDTDYQTHSQEPTLMESLAKAVKEHENAKRKNQEQLRESLKALSRQKDPGYRQD